MLKKTIAGLALGVAAGCAGAQTAVTHCVWQSGVAPSRAAQLCTALEDAAPVGQTFDVLVIAATDTALEAQLITPDATVVGPIRLSRKDAALDDRAFAQLASVLLRGLNSQ